MAERIIKMSDFWVDKDPNKSMHEVDVMGLFGAIEQAQKEVNEEARKELEK